MSLPPLHLLLLLLLLLSQDQQQHVGASSPSSSSSSSLPALSTQCTTAFGPALSSRVAHMRRHLTIQLCTTDGMNLTSSPFVDFSAPPYDVISGGVPRFSGKLEALNWRGGAFTADLEIFDRGDGKFCDRFFCTEI